MCLRLFKKVAYSVLPSVARHPSLCSGRRPGMSSRGTPVPWDPSADASGRHKRGARGDLPFLSFRAKREISSPCLPKVRKCRGTPRLTPRGDKKRKARGDLPFLSFRAKREISTPCNTPPPVVPRRSLTSFGMTLHEETPWLTLHEGTPRLTPRGDKKREARGDKSYPVISSEARNLLTLSSQSAQAPRDPSADASG